MEKVAGTSRVHQDDLGAPQMRRRLEKLLIAAMMLCSLVAVLTTIGIVLSMVVETVRFFELVPVHHFLFGLEWSPQTALRSDQAGSSGLFGAVPIFTGTLLITFIAMLVAVPLGLMAAIHLSEYAGPKMRSVVKPLLELLAGIPTVVYGFILEYFPEYPLVHLEPLGDPARLGGGAGSEASRILLASAGAR